MDAENPPQNEIARPEIALNDPELLADPYGGYGRIREETPIARGRLVNGNPVWVVTRYEDVLAVLTDRRFANNSRSLPGGDTDSTAEALVKFGISREHVAYLAGNIVHTDPPDHTRLRKLVSREFSVRRIAGLRPRVETITTELLDALPGHAEAGVVDLLEHFAYPLPITVICELLGVPPEDRKKWRGWSNDYTSVDPRRMDAMLGDMSAYVRDFAERRRAEPGDDLISGLALAHSTDSDRLSDVELVTMVLSLMIAGHETTAHLVCNGVVALLTHPDQLALLRENPALMPGAVQELLRYCGPIVSAMVRYAAEDVKLGDTVIERGDRVQVVLAAANHDPRRFADPDRLDITREPDGAGIQHLAFSQGLHYCLGASLAAQEAEVALAGLLARFPDLALAVEPRELEWGTIPTARQLVRLPVTL